MDKSTHYQICGHACAVNPTFNQLFLTADCDLDRLVSSLRSKSIELECSTYKVEDSILHICGTSNYLMDSYINTPEFVLISWSIRGEILNETKISVGRKDFTIQAIVALSDDEGQDLKMTGRFDCVSESLTNKYLRSGDPILIFELQEDTRLESIKETKVIAPLIEIKTLPILTAKNRFVVKKLKSQIIFSPSHAGTTETRMEISIPGFDYVPDTITLVDPVMTVQKHTHCHGTLEGFITEFSSYIEGEILLNINGEKIRGSARCFHHTIHREIELRITVDKCHQEQNGQILCNLTGGRDLDFLLNIDSKIKMCPTGTLRLVMISNQIVRGYIQAELMFKPRGNRILKMHGRIDLPSTRIIGRINQSSNNGLILDELIPSKWTLFVTRSAKIKYIDFRTEMSCLEYHMKIHVELEWLMVNNIVIENMCFNLHTSRNNEVEVNVEGFATAINEVGAPTILITGMSADGAWTIEGNSREEIQSTFHAFLSSKAKSSLLEMVPHFKLREFDFNFNTATQVLDLHAEILIDNSSCQLTYYFQKGSMNETLMFVTETSGTLFILGDRVSFEREQRKESIDEDKDDN